MPPQQQLPGRGEILIRVQACDVNNVDPAISTGAESPPHVCALDAAGTVIATGDRVTRFAIGDEVFGHFPARSWAWVEPRCVRTTADGPHVELRPERLDSLAAAAVAHNGVTAKTILRAAKVRRGQTALVLGATSGTGTMLVSLLAEARAHVIADAPDATEDKTADPVDEALTSHPDVDLLVDFTSFGEPYFITATARHGTIASALPRPNGPGVPRIAISARPGDLAALAQRALDEHHPIDIAYVHRLAN